MRWRSEDELDHRADRSPDYCDFDKREARKPTRVIVRKHHRGPAKISFPLKTEKALIKLTDAKTAQKAMRALRFAEISRLSKLYRGYSKKWIEEHAALHINDLFEDDQVTEEQFRTAGLIFIHTPRPGIDIAKHTKRIFKLFSDLGIPIGDAKLLP
jgi:hypothetical protein